MSWFSELFHATTNPTQTTTVNLSPEQKQLYGLAMPGVEQFASSVPQHYPGTQIAGFTPEQTAGQQQVLGAAGTQQNLASGAAGSLPFFFNDIWKPESNPNLQGAVDASVRPIVQNLTESELPAIRSEFGMGNYGGSRQGVAEGLAIGRTNQAVGDTASKVVQNQYDTNINAMLKAYGLLPGVQNAQTAAGATTSAVGDVRQALQQAQLNENVGNYQYDQYAPFLQSKEILALLAGLPGGSTTATGNSPAASPLSTGLGVAAGGAALANQLPGLGSSLKSGAQAVLPFLFA